MRVQYDYIESTSASRSRRVLTLYNPFTPSFRIVCLKQSIGPLKRAGLSKGWLCSRTLTRSNGCCKAKQSSMLLSCNNNKLHHIKLASKTLETMPAACHAGSSAWVPLSLCSTRIVQVSHCHRRCPSMLVEHSQRWAHPSTSSPASLSDFDEWTVLLVLPLHAREEMKQLVSTKNMIDLCTPFIYSKLTCNEPGFTTTFDMSDKMTCVRVSQNFSQINLHASQATHQFSSFSPQTMQT
jgi:hypothetical protein